MRHPWTVIVAHALGTTGIDHVCLMVEVYNRVHERKHIFYSTMMAPLPVHMDRKEKKVELGGETLFELSL